MDTNDKRMLEDHLSAVESQLSLLESTPLTDGGTYPWSHGMVDQYIFLQNQIDLAEEELELIDVEDDETVSKLLSGAKSNSAIIPKDEIGTDRTYVLGLCDEILREVSLRKYPYEFIVDYELVRKTVDAFYMGHNLIVNTIMVIHTKNSLSIVPQRFLSSHIKTLVQIAN